MTSASKAVARSSTKRYFEEQLQRIREIRLSERKFYQKITDIYATSMDYDVTAQATKRFFATVQNKLHWAIHGQTAAEVIVAPCRCRKQQHGLDHLEGCPTGKIQKFDVVVAKNYLTEHEMAQLQRLVSAYLDVGRGHGTAADSDDDAGLGDPPESVH